MNLNIQDQHIEEVIDLLRKAGIPFILSERTEDSIKAAVERYVEQDATGEVAVCKKEFFKEADDKKFKAFVKEILVDDLVEKLSLFPSEEDIADSLEYLSEDVDNFQSLYKNR